NSDNIFNLELLKERCLKINFSKGEYQKYARKVYDDSNNLLIEELDKHSPLLILFSGAIIAILGASIVCDINVELSTTSTTTTSFSSTTTTKTTNVKININFNGDISTLVENTKNLVMGKK
ncbi:MAG: hypothetical protein U9N59_00385, partial [Campylobacterota bacterium]|nr:hypothetical protein [Campylobacterota bacterium]